MLGVILLGLVGFVGCSNEKVYEQENKEIVSFPINYYSLGLSSVPGQPIELNFENATFFIEIEKGSFEYDNDIKDCSISSGDTFYFCPAYKTNDSFITIEEETFIDIKILKEEKIVGYSVVKINYENLGKWIPKLIVSNIFVNKTGEIISVSEKYANDKIATYHKMNHSSLIYYMDVMEMTSSRTFNYEEPNYGYISLNRTSSYLYKFNGEQIYELVSTFNNIPIIPAKTLAKKEELDKLKINGIIIEVSYTYTNLSTSNNDAIVYFYVLENGILLFEDNRNTNLYYSDTNAIYYDELKNEIMKIGDNKIIPNTKTYYTRYR